jgi:polar amino acid transport system substrate-binding protein
MKDLQTLRVSAFQRARQILGTTFSDIVDQNPRYEEVAKQEGQVQRLLLGRTDAVILEQRVFYYYLAQLLGDEEGDRYPKDKVRQHDLFPPTHYHFAFREAGHRQWFDRQLAKMKADGRYERILPPMAPPLLPETKSQPMMDWLVTGSGESQWMERYFIALPFFSSAF